MTLSVTGARTVARTTVRALRGPLCLSVAAPSGPRSSPLPHRRCPSPPRPLPPLPAHPQSPTRPSTHSAIGSVASSSHVATAADSAEAETSASAAAGRPPTPPLSLSPTGVACSLGLPTSSPHSPLPPPLPPQIAAATAVSGRQPATNAATPSPGDAPAVATADTALHAIATAAGASLAAVGGGGRGMSARDLPRSRLPHRGHRSASAVVSSGAAPPPSAAAQTGTEGLRCVRARARRLGAAPRPRPPGGRQTVARARRVTAAAGRVAAAQRHARAARPVTPAAAERTARADAAPAAGWWPAQTPAWRRRGRGGGGGQRWPTAGRGWAAGVPMVVAALTRRRGGKVDGVGQRGCGGREAGSGRRGGCRATSEACQTAGMAVDARPRRGGGAAWARRGGDAGAVGTGGWRAGACASGRGALVPGTRTRRRGVVRPSRRPFCVGHPSTPLADQFWLILLGPPGARPACVVSWRAHQRAAVRRPPVSVLFPSVSRHLSAIGGCPRFRPSTGAETPPTPVVAA